MWYRKYTLLISLPLGLFILGLSIWLVQREGEFWSLNHLIGLTAGAVSALLLELNRFRLERQGKLQKVIEKNRKWLSPYIFLALLPLYVVLKDVLRPILDQNISLKIILFSWLGIFIMWASIRNWSDAYRKEGLFKELKNKSNLKKTKRSIILDLR